jgi:hypothetical protein
MILRASLTSIARPENAAPMRSFHSAPTDKRAEPAPAPIYPLRASSDSVVGNAGDCNEYPTCNPG